MDYEMYGAILFRDFFLSHSVTFIHVQFTKIQRLIDQMVQEALSSLPCSGSLVWSYP